MRGGHRREKREERGEIREKTRIKLKERGKREEHTEKREERSEKRDERTEKREGRRERRERRERR